MKIILRILLILVFISCKEKNALSESSDISENENQIKMEYYDPEFKLSSNSKIRTDGYYEIKEYKSFNKEKTDNYYEKPNLGFIHFFKDGYCRVGSWNGISKYPSDILERFETGKGYVFFGLYKIKSDTVKIEYLYNPLSPGAGQAKNRYTISGLISKDKIIIVNTGNEFIESSYIYPYSYADTLTSRCVGDFIKKEYSPEQLDNYLKENIGEYINTEN